MKIPPNCIFVLQDTFKSNDIRYLHEIEYPMKKNILENRLYVHDIQNLR